MTSTSTVQVQTAAARQPFAPVDRSRLHRLTSTKNRQNALPPTPTLLKRKAAVFEVDFDSTPTAIKRKAPIFEVDEDNSENIDPALFASSKRARGKDGLTLADYSKPTKSHLVLTKALSSQNEVAASDPVKSIISRPVISRPVISRPVLHPRSPASKVHPQSPASKPNTSTISSLSAPAGRSPTKKQRVGILNRRRTASPLTRIDPPRFGIGRSVASAPFSIDAALGGTIPSYRRRTRGAVRAPTSLREPLVKASWFFEIHEDTAEETMTNLMEHSTCVLDISSDEEGSARREDRGKENVPPTDDVSQTTSRSSMASGSTSVRAEVDPDAIEVDRNPLGNLAPKDFYPEGLSENDVVYVDDDEDDEDDEEELTPSEVTDASDMGKNYDFEFTAPNATMGGSMEIEGSSNKGKAALDELMQRSSGTTGHAALFQPLEEAEENFEVWESASAKGEAGEDE